MHKFQFVWGNLTVLMRGFPFWNFLQPTEHLMRSVGLESISIKSFYSFSLLKIYALGHFLYLFTFFFSRSRRLLARQRHRSSGDGGRYLCEFFFAVENAGVDLVLFLVMLLFFRSKFGTDKPLKKCMSMRREKNRIKNVVTALRIVESMKKRKLFTGQSKRRKKERKRANDNYNV